jgi:hypothetical protein
MLKKFITVLTAVALSGGLTTNVFAAFGDLELIRVITDKTSGSTLEIATDLGNINSLGALTTITKVGGGADAFTNFIGTSTFSNLSVIYYAVQRTALLNGSLWLSSNTLVAPTSPGVTQIQNKLSVTGGPVNTPVNLYFASLALATGSTSTVIANNTNLTSLEGKFPVTTFGGYANGFSSNTLLSLTNAATTPVATTIYKFGNGTNMALQQTGVKVLDLTTNADGSTSIIPTSAIQTITFGTTPTVAVGGSGVVSATGGLSGNPVTFTSTTPAYCTVSGANGSIITGVAEGTCTIAADQAGNGTTYNAATQTTQSITVSAATQAAAPTVTSTAATPVTETTATLNGTVSANNAITTVTFEYGMTNVYGSTTTAAESPLAASATNTAVSAAITGLTCATPYHFWAVAVNSAGITNSTDLTFTTAACPATIKLDAVITWPTASAITYGQTLAASTLSGGASTPAGTFAFTTPTTAPVAGTAAHGVTFTPNATDAATYNSATSTVSVTVNKADATITWPTAASAITFGQTLAASTLTGGSSIQTGTFAFTTPTTAPVAGTAAHGVTFTFTPTEAANYNSATSTVSVTVNKANATITWPTAATAITYGQTLAASNLSGGSSTPEGTFAFTTPTTAPVAGTAAHGVTFTPTEAANYNSATSTVSVVVAKATPTITWPTASAITYGQTLAASNLSGGSSIPAGTFAFTTPTTAPAAGTAPQSVTFTPNVTDAVNYNGATSTVSVVVAKATPPITWGTPAAVNVGATLSSNTQLTATSTLAGTFVYTPPAGTVMNTIGSQTLQVLFTPTDAVNYTTQSASVTLVVTNKTIPAISWTTPEDITYGTALSGTQLNATSGGVAGSFSYNPPLTTVLAIGPHTLSVTFTPTDGGTYSSNNASTNLTVAPAAVGITLSNTAQVYNGSPRSVTVTTTPASLAHSVTYNGSATPPTAAGSYPVSVTVTEPNYSGSASGTLDISKATPVITWVTPTDISYGTALSATQLNAASVVAGAFAYTPPAGTIMAAGSSQTVSAAFTPTDTNNYFTPAAKTVLISVTAAPQVITFGTAPTITVGASGNVTATGGASGQPVSFSVTPASVCSISDSSVTGVSVGDCTVTANQTGTGNYTAAAAVTQKVSIGKGSQTIGAITFDPLTLKVGGTTTVRAAASSGLPLTFTSTTPAVCSVNGATLTATGGGTCMVAANQAGNSTYSAANETTQSISVSPIAPGAPTIGTATAGTAQATVTFTAPSSNGGSDITGYTVISNPAGGIDSNAGTTSLSHVVTGLTNGTAYTFTVTAKSVAGAGTASAPSTSVTPATLPGAPTIGTATAGNGQATVTFTAPASNGGSTITGYTVTSSPGGLIGTGTAGPITVPRLTNGTAYTFTVTATNAVGTGSASTPSNPVTPLIPPIIFTVTPTIGANGSVNPATSQSVKASATTSFVITPNSGFQISTVSGCGGTLSGTTYTTAGIINDCAVTVDFIVIPAVKGDLSGEDKKVTIADALLALQFAIGLKTPTAAQIAAGDVAPIGKPDGKIDIADAVAILQKSVGLLSW